MQQPVNVEFRADVKQDILKRSSFPLYLTIIVAAVAFLQTFTMLAPIYLSLLLIFFISLALNPVVNKLRSLTGGRNGATGLVVLVMFAVVILMSWAFYIPLTDSVSNLSKAIPGYWERLQRPLIKMEQHANQSEVRMQAEVTTEIAKASDTTDRDSNSTSQESEDPKPSKTENSIRSSLAEMLRGVVGSLTKVAFNGAQIMVVLVTVFFGVIFTLLNPLPVMSFIFSLVPERHHGPMEIIMKKIGQFAPSWGGSTLAGMATIGLLVFVLMWPLLGLMDAMVLGLIAGLLESVPFVGPTLSTVPAILLAIGKGGMMPLWVLLAYVVVQALENNIIIPLIMAKGMKIHALAVIFSMLLCVSAFGVLGVLVAAPLVAVVNILHEEIYRKKFLPSVNDSDLDKLSRKVLQLEGSSRD